MFKKYKKIITILLSVLIIGVILWAKSYFYDYKMNHNFKVISEGKVYKSGVIPPDKLADFVKEHKIKSIIDLRFPGTADLVNNPEIPTELIAEKEAASKIEGLNYFNLGSDQVPKPENLEYFFKIMDNKANYPVLIHCFHGVGRAEMYSAIYRIEYENWDRDEARKETRFLTKFSSFDLGKPKGDFLHSYVKRNQKENFKKQDDLFWNCNQLNKKPELNKEKNPNIVALKLYNNSEIEGNSKVDVSNKLIAENTYWVTLVNSNVPDDAISDIKMEYELKRKNNNWELISAKKSWKCRRNESKDWNNLICN